MKLCKDYKHIIDDEFCKLNPYEVFYYVTGESRTEYDSCSTVRRASISNDDTSICLLKKPCGPEAIHFEPKD